MIARIVGILSTRPRDREPPAQGRFTLYALTANLLIEDYDWEIAGATTS